MTQKEQIADLKKQLAEAKQNTYIYETNHLQCSDGELHVGFGDYGENEKWLVWNTDSLFKDLPFIINQVLKENKKQQNIYLEQIKDSIKEL
tara:strand:- start:217 stop:489 length:273 start_codon:yes stop_codon:yes gene_type:complete